MPTTPGVPSVEAETPAPKTALDERRPMLLAMPEEHIERQPKVDASVAAEQRAADRAAARRDGRSVHRAPAVSRARSACS